VTLNIHLRSEILGSAGNDDERFQFSCI
jgi:hypothetical protein